MEPKTIQNAAIQRIKIYMEKTGIGVNELSETTKIASSTISRILTGKVDPHNSTIKKIVKHYPELNEKWVFSGEGEMLQDPVKSNINWKDEAYNTIKEENTYLKKQLEVLNNVITNLLQQGKPNFRKATLQAAKTLIEQQGTLAGGLGLRKVA